MTELILCARGEGEADIWLEAVKECEKEFEKRLDLTEQWLMECLLFIG